MVVDTHTRERRFGGGLALARAQRNHLPCGRRGARGEGEQGDGGEGAKYWQQVLTEIKNRGVEDVLMLVCDGLKGLPDSVATVWPATIAQTCVEGNVVLAPAMSSAPRSRPTASCASTWRIWAMHARFAYWSGR